MAGSKPRLRVGLIGTGFMGKTHVFGFAAAPRVFDLPYEPVLHTVADRTEALAAGAAAALGFANGTGDWQTIIADPEIDLVDITAPNALHKEMALAAIAAGKHVYCEKPLAPLAADAREMIEAGELGEIRSYRGVHAEDYMADAAAPFGFRNDPVGGGALADIGSHALATAEYLLGPIAAVLGDCSTVIVSRPDGTGENRAIETDDIGRAFLRFDSGGTGSVEANWIAMGRKMQHDFEVYGSKGALAFSQERFNELHFYSAADGIGRRGFRRIEAGPEHPPYGRFCVAPGHQLGFNDLKAIEVARYMDAIAGNTPEPFNFRAGLRVQELVEAIHRSAREGRWLAA